MIGVDGATHCAGVTDWHYFCRSLYIASATVFWAFTLTEDAKRPIDDTAFVPGIVSHQKPFSLVFEPRMNVAHLHEVMGKAS